MPTLCQMPSVVGETKNYFGVDRDVDSVRHTFCLFLHDSLLHRMTFMSAGKRPSTFRSNSTYDVTKFDAMKASQAMRISYKYKH